MGFRIFNVLVGLHGWGSKNPAGYCRYVTEARECDPLEYAAVGRTNGSQPYDDPSDLASRGSEASPN